MILHHIGRSAFLSISGSNRGELSRLSIHETAQVTIQVIACMYRARYNKQIHGSFRNKEVIRKMIQQLKDKKVIFFDVGQINFH